MESINQHFSKPYSYHLQDECMVGKFLKPYIVQAVGDNLDFMVLADGVVCYPMGGKHVENFF
jgi:hypothetical protein